MKRQSEAGGTFDQLIQASSKKGKRKKSVVDRNTNVPAASGLNPVADRPVKKMSTALDGGLEELDSVGDLSMD